MGEQEFDDFELIFDICLSSFQVYLCKDVEDPLNINDLLLNPIYE